MMVKYQGHQPQQEWSWTNQRVMNKKTVIP